jgi:hypothetical protein
MNNYDTGALWSLLRRMVAGIFSLVYLSVFLPANSADANNLPITGPADITLEPILSSGWVCYIQDDSLYIRTVKTDPVKIISGTDAGGTILNPDMKVLDKSVFVVWTERGMGNHRVKFTALQYDTAAPLRKDILLSQSTKSSYAKFLAEENGRLYVLEVLSDQIPEINLHLSLDYGKIFQKTRLDMNSSGAFFNVQPLVIHDVLYIFYAFSRDEKTFIAVSSFDIPAMTLRESKVLKETEGISFIQSVRVNDKPMVIYKTASRNKYCMEGFIQQNTSWDAFSITGAEGLDVARMDSYVWKDGRILIVFSGSESGKFSQRIYASVSEDDGKHWDMKRIDSRESENTRSWLPRMAVDGEKVSVVWEDARDIRSAVRSRLSSDRGATWIKNDFPVSDTKYNTLRPRISFADGMFYITWHQFRNDERDTADIVMRPLSWNDAAMMASQKEPPVAAGEKEKLLRERINSYWEGMIKKDTKRTYEIHDPFFKAKIPFEYYVSHRGPMVYHSHTIEAVKIEGNIARVKIRVKYEVPKIRMLGKETSVPPTEVVAEDVYIHMDGTWFRQFIDTLSGGSTIDYE